MNQVGHFKQRRKWMPRPKDRDAAGLVSVGPGGWCGWSGWRGWRGWRRGAPVCGKPGWVRKGPRRWVRFFWETCVVLLGDWRGACGVEWSKSKETSQGAVSKLGRLTPASKPTCVRISPRSPSANMQ